jgi:hypothetical protein
MCVECIWICPAEAFFRDSVKFNKLQPSPFHGTGTQRHPPRRLEITGSRDERPLDERLFVFFVTSPSLTVDGFESYRNRLAAARIVSRQSLAVCGCVVCLFNSYWGDRLENKLDRTVARKEIL